MIKIVAISDTHTYNKSLPPGDILIHAGDFSSSGSYKNTQDFLYWMKAIKHNYSLVVVVPGNHDRYIESNLAQAKQEFEDAGIILLVDDSVTYMGRKIYGHPWTPIFSNWAFMGDGRKLKLVNEAIPSDTDILVTHGPPKGILDTLGNCSSEPGKQVGCDSLAEAVKRVKPQLHIFGHIHDQAGILVTKQTTFVNAAYLDDHYNPNQGATVLYI